jgi:hypothetical protein
MASCRHLIADFIESSANDRKDSQSTYEVDEAKIGKQ